MCGAYGYLCGAWHCWAFGAFSWAKLQRNAAIFYLLHKGGGSSLRASEASAAIHNSKIDCHENSADSLAMTENVSEFQNDKI